MARRNRHPGSERTALADDRDRRDHRLAEADEFPRGDLQERLIAAWAESIATRGYARTTVRDIIALSHISRGTFYGAFKGKDNAFVSIHRDVLESFAGHVERAAEAVSDWPGKIAAGLAAVLEAAAIDPDGAQVLFGDPFAAGPRMGYCHDALVDRFAPCLAAGRELAEGPPAPPSLEAALLGSVIAIVNGRVRAGEAGRLPSLAPSLAELVLAPYVGVEAASLAARSTAQTPPHPAGRR